MRRTCDFCGTRLEGRRRHGIVTPDGRRIRCQRSRDECDLHAARLRGERADLTEDELENARVAHGEEDAR